MALHNYVGLQLCIALHKDYGLSAPLVSSGGALLLEQSKIYVAALSSVFQAIHTEKTPTILGFGIIIFDPTGVEYNYTLL